MQGWNSTDYALLDFGGGRKLERFGGVILDRPSPAALQSTRSPHVDWSVADAFLDTHGKLAAGSVPDRDWRARFEEIVFNLKLTPFGHLGLFPEQACNWLWLKSMVSSAKSLVERPLSALNLFAYTGGSTLALAAAGAEVVHVDASAPAVKWARRNAVDSGMSAQPIRWIVEDARKFVARELRRRNRYDIIVLDPPSYGHGPRGNKWSIDQDLKKLLLDCLEMQSTSEAAILLVTAHCDTLSAAALASWTSAVCRDRRLITGRLGLEASPDRSLDAGFFVRGSKAF